MFIFFKEGNSEKFVNWRKGILPSVCFVMILKQSVKRSSLAFLSPRLLALLRSSSSMQPRSQRSPSAGTDRREVWERGCSSHRILFTRLHYRNRVTLKIAYLLASMSLHDYASVLRDLITLFSVYTSWQTGRFRMWVNSKKAQDLTVPNGNCVYHLHNHFHLPQIGRKSSNLSCSESVCLQIYVLAVSPQPLGPVLFVS